jgi:hypothetical protein
VPLCAHTSTDVSPRVTVGVQMGIGRRSGARSSVSDASRRSAGRGRPTPAPLVECREDPSGCFSKQHRQHPLRVEVVDAKRQILRAFARPVAGRRDRGKVRRRPAEVDLGRRRTTEILMRAWLTPCREPGAETRPRGSTTLCRARAWKEPTGGERHPDYHPVAESKLVL